MWVVESSIVGKSRLVRARLSRMYQTSSPEESGSHARADAGPGGTRRKQTSDAMHAPLVQLETELDTLTLTAFSYV